MRIGNYEYTVATLPLTTQFSLSAKLSPIVSIMSLQEDRALVKKSFPRSFTALCQGMPVDEQRWVLDTCLGQVTRDGTPPAKVWVGGMPAFQDIDMNLMLELVWEVIDHHRIIDFFSAGPSSSTGQAGGQPGSSGSDLKTTG